MCVSNHTNPFVPMFRIPWTCWKTDKAKNSSLSIILRPYSYSLLSCTFKYLRHFRGQYELLVKWNKNHRVHLKLNILEFKVYSVTFRGQWKCSKFIFPFFFHLFVTLLHIDHKPKEKKVKIVSLWNNSIYHLLILISKFNFLQ